ncbi:hypothetical protein Anas_10768 [Armadillidium nasatum]|uniref:Zinc finger CCCH domain-containing protein 13 n=1 Tax=Armadillidium nasatum TaxID=96803 RepID=A0A5N5T7Y5_9CRUS|nr:hypothetical protein Anas_10768 [Armadillidium nasatum]
MREEENLKEVREEIENFLLIEERIGNQGNLDLSSGRKGGHGQRKEYKDFSSSKDHDRSHLQKSRSPSRHHRKTTLKKLVSPSPVTNRKSRKQNSPQLHKRGHKRSLSPRDRLEYHARVIERSLSHGRDSSQGPSRPRDPRIEDRLKRSPEVIGGRDRFGVRDSPRRYEREEYQDKRDRRSSPGPRGTKENERKDIPRHRDFDPRDREPYDDRPAREDPRREGRDKERDPRDKKPVRDREIYRERDCDDDKKGRYHREAEYQRDREISIRSRIYDDERDYYQRPHPTAEMDSRESSIERSYDDPYDRYSDHDRLRFDGPRCGRYDDLHPQEHRGDPGEYATVDEMRIQEERRGRPALPLEARFPEDRRKNVASLDRAHPDSWEDRPPASVLDRIQDLKTEHFPAHHSHRLHPPHQGPSLGLVHRRGEWLDAEMPAGVGRPHGGHVWEKHHIKKRRGLGGEWTEDFPLSERLEWEEGMEWTSEQRERIHPPVIPHEKVWSGPHHSRRFHGGNWGNEIERGEWVGPPLSIQERLGGRIRMVQPLHHPMGRELPLHLHTGHRNRGLQRKDPVMIEQDALEGNSPQAIAERNNRADIEARIEIAPPTKRPSGIEILSAKQNQLHTPSHQQSTSQSQQEQQQQQQQQQLQIRGTDAQQSNSGPSGSLNISSEPVLIEKDNFSDFSDDPDDILNQEVDDEAADATKESPTEEKTAIKEGPSYEEILDEEERMDLEEISDEEFEDEKQAKFSVADALDINWSSLISDERARPPPIQGSALKRFRPLHLLARLGVSTKYARPEILQKVTVECHNIELERKTDKSSSNVKSHTNEIEKEITAREAKIKEEVKEEQMEVITELEVKGEEGEKEEGEKQTNKETEEEEEFTTEEKDGKIKKEEKIFEGEPLPAILPVVVPGGVIRCLRQESMGRSHLFNLGSHRRALCAREDLCLRRRLCNLPEEDLIGLNVQYEPQLFREAVNLLKAK